MTGGQHLHSIFPGRYLMSKLRSASSLTHLRPVAFSFAEVRMYVKGLSPVKTVNFGEASYRIVQSLPILEPETQVFLHKGGNFFQLVTVLVKHKQ